jgi:hypothetical protein
MILQQALEHVTIPFTFLLPKASLKCRLHTFTFSNNFSFNTKCILMARQYTYTHVHMYAYHIHVYMYAYHIHKRGDVYTHIQEWRIYSFIYNTCYWKIKMHLKTFDVFFHTSSRTGFQHSFWITDCGEVRICVKKLHIQSWISSILIFALNYGTKCRHVLNKI